MAAGDWELWQKVSSHVLHNCLMTRIFIASNELNTNVGVVYLEYPYPRTIS